MIKHYYHLGPEQRAFIILSIKECYILTQLERSLARSLASNIFREQASNALLSVRYKVAHTDKQAFQRLRALQRKLALDTKL